MLNIYSDRSFLPPGSCHCIALIPFWGDTIGHSGYRSFAELAPRFWRLTTLDDADVALLPFDGNLLLPRQGPPPPVAMDFARRFVIAAQARGLRTIVIVNSDDERHLPLPPAWADSLLIFRTSLNTRTRWATEFALPAWHEDLVADHLDGQPTWRRWSSRPLVSFCGLAAQGVPSMKRRIKHLGMAVLERVGWHVPDNDGVFLRKRAMDALDSNGSLETSFVVRDRAFLDSGQDPQQQLRFRNEYIDSIVNSDYVLCVRGYGNFSFRFFETLSLGRIPVLVDTLCVLPYDNLYDYRDTFVFLSKEEVDRIGDHVTAFHLRFASERSFVAHQQRLREFWKEYLSPEGFFSHLPIHWGDHSRPGQGASLHRANRLSRSAGDP